MAGYPVIDPAGVDIYDEEGNLTHYNVGDVVPLAKLISRRYNWLVNRGYLSETETDFGGGSGGGTWGSITGTLSSQTDLQAALDAKAPLAGPTFTGTVTLPATTSVGNVSSTELGYLDGVTSAIQTQLNNKAASSHTHAQADITNLTSDLALKAPLASPTFTGTVALPSTTTLGGNAIWHAGNDGPGSGLDADTLDGNHAAAFATSGHDHSGVYQPIDADLTAIAAQTGTGLLKRTGTDTWTLDTTEYTTNTGTVTSVGITTPTGLSVSPASITTSGTFAITLTAGYEIPTTTDLAAKAPLASPTFTGTVNLPSVAGTKSVTFGSGYATLGLVTIGRSGAGYGTIGDGYRTTSTANVYNYDRGDYATMLSFASGGFSFQTADIGVAGDPVTFTERFSIGNGGDVTASYITMPDGHIAITDAAAERTLTLLAYGFNIENTNPTGDEAQVPFSVDADGDLAATSVESADVRSIALVMDAF